MNAKYTNNTLSNFHFYKFVDVNNLLRFRIALRKTFPQFSRPIIGILQTFLGRENSSNFSFVEIPLHLHAAIRTKNRISNIKHSPNTM